MKGPRLLALSLLVIALGCQDHSSPTEPTRIAAPPDPSAIISDGAHCGPAGSVPACNRDFFFLPPMVPLPVGNPNFELGKFNNALRPRLRIEICELQPQNLNAQGLPTAATNCVAGAPKKTFGAGAVNLVNLPLRENGWWSLFGLPADGFYYVLWDTRQSNLSVNKFYRIKVLIDGSTVPLGVADVDPMSSLREWKFTRTGEVVQLIDDVLLPIPFRVEKGALCSDVNLCTSATVTNHTPDGSPQIVRVEAPDGSFIAGVLIPDGFLPPPPGPQSVVLTITRVNTGANNVAAGTQANPCHPNLQLQQFNSCFNFSTIPALPVIEGSEEGHQFLKALTVAVCFTLHDTEDPREPYVQLYSSDPGEDAKPLPSATAAQILSGPGGQTCGDNLVAVNNNNSSGFTRFASAGWQKVKHGLGRLFGVQTAYAVDLGLGGLAFDLSNIGPAMYARMSTGEFYPNVSVEAGATTNLGARVVGTRVHDGTNPGTGIPGMPVTFSLGQANAGGLRLLGSEDALTSQVTAITNSGEYFPGSIGSGGGFTAASWTAPLTPGSYTVTATSPYTNGTLVTYQLSVRPLFGSIQGAWQNENPNTPNIVNFFIGIEGTSAVVQVFGQCSPTDCDWGPTTADTAPWNTHQQIVAVWDQGFATKTVTIKWLSPNRMQTTTHADFTEGDGRTDYTITEFFQRPT